MPVQVFHGSFSTNWIFRICILAALIINSADGQETALNGNGELVPQPQNPVPNPLCDGCATEIPPRVSCGLIVVADFQPNPLDPCEPGKTTVASVQQWALFDLLDMVQSDVHFGSVFVTNQAHVLRPLTQVRPTERSEIRRKIMQAQPRSGGSLVDGVPHG